MIPQNFNIDRLKVAMPMCVPVSVSENTPLYSAKSKELLECQETIFLRLVLGKEKLERKQTVQAHSYIFLKELFQY